MNRGRGRRWIYHGKAYYEAFLSALIDESAHMLQDSRYIHRNPAEIEGATDEVSEPYVWSSYLAYVNQAKASGRLVRSRTYRMIGSKYPVREYKSFILSGNDVLTTPLYSGDCLAGIFGGKSFRQSVFDGQEMFEKAEGVRSLVVARVGMEVMVATLNKTLKSYIVAILGAEYILRYLPIGTHDWRYFVKPKTLLNWVTNRGFALSDETGMFYNPLSGKWHYSQNQAVNYCLCFSKE